MHNSAAKVPQSEITARIGRFQQKLLQENLDGALILQKADLYYFSGTVQQSHLYIPASGDPVLMVYRSLPRAMAESPLETIIALASPKKIPDLLKSLRLVPPRRLGMELDVLPVNLFRTYEYVFQGPEMVDISPAVRHVRAIKSPYEIDLINRAACYSDQLNAFAKTIIRPGMTELELAGMVEGHARKLGHQGIVRMRLWGAETFYGHLMSGPPAAAPSYMSSPTGGMGPSPATGQGPGMAPVLENQPILIDYVFAMDGYMSDQTRIFAIGSLPDELVKAHETMLHIQGRIQREARPGTTGGHLYDLAVQMAGEAGYGDYFMGADDRRIRFIGHGIGLELDEYPFLAQGQTMPLEENMIVALEPKLIFPGKGVVGIENTHVVTPQGLKPLGRYPDAITIIPA